MKKSHIHRPWLVEQVGDKRIGICRDCGAFCIVAHPLPTTEEAGR